MITLVNATDLIKYNANARGNNTSDCVARGLSLAFNLGYDEVLKELRATQKEMRQHSYKITPVITRVISNHHSSAKCVVVQPQDRISVAEFVEQNSTCTLIILCGSKVDDRSTHLVTAIDGKLYDTWDSRNYFVYKYWAIEGIVHEFGFNLDEHKETLRDQTYKDIDRFGLKYCQKYDINPEELSLHRTQWQENVLSIHLWWKSSKTGKKYDFSFRLSYSPTMTLEKAQKYTSDTVKTRLYDRFYTAVKQDKDIEEANKFLAETGEKATDPWFSDQREKRLFNSLPAKIRPFVEYISVENPGQYSDSVYVRIKSIPGDPKRSEEPKVRFRHYDSASVKAMITRYLTTWEHPEVDYDPYEEY